LQNRFKSLFLQGEEEEEEEEENLSGNEDERGQDTDINAQWEKPRRYLLIHVGVFSGV